MDRPSASSTPGRLRLEPSGRDTLSDRAYRAIRAAIINRELETGHYYSEAWLAGILGVSRTPTHSALLQLEIEGVVEIFAQAQIAQNGGGMNAVGQVFLAEPSLLPTPSQILAHAGPNLVTTYTSPGTNDADGVINPGRAGWITLVPPAAGKYTFSLQYAAPGGGTATFQNRALVVRVTR